MSTSDEKKAPVSGATPPEGGDGNRTLEPDEPVLEQDKGQSIEELVAGRSGEEQESSAMLDAMKGQEQNVPRQPEKVQPAETSSPRPAPSAKKEETGFTPKNVMWIVGAPFLAVLLVLALWRNDSSRTHTSAQPDIAVTQSSSEPVTVTTIPPAETESAQEAEALAPMFSWQEFEQPAYSCEDKYQLFLTLRVPHCFVMAEAVESFETDGCAPVIEGNKRYRHFEATCPDAFIAAFPPPPPPEPELEETPISETDGVQLAEARSPGQQESFSENDRASLGRIEKGVSSLEERVGRLEGKVATLEGFHKMEEPVDPDDPCPPSLGKMRDACYGEYEESLREAEAAAAAQLKRKQEEEARQKAEADQQREAAARKKAEAEARQKADAEAAAASAEQDRPKKEAERLQREEEARQKAETEAARHREEELKKQQQLAALTPAATKALPPEAPREQYGEYFIANGEDIVKTFGIRQPGNKPGKCRFYFKFGSQTFVTSLKINGRQYEDLKFVDLDQGVPHHFSFTAPGFSRREGSWRTIAFTDDDGTVIERLVKGDGDNIVLDMQFGQGCQTSLLK